MTEVVTVGDWNDNHVVAIGSPCSDSEEQRNNRGLNGNIGGPPPKLIPVSGKLEKASFGGGFPKCQVVSELVVSVYLKRP